MTWTGLSALAIGVWVTWGLALAVGLWGRIWCTLRKSDRIELLWRAGGRVHQELWLFVPPGILIGTIHDWHHHHTWAVFFDALSLYNWWTLRNWPEDNHWKRRGKKLREAVAVRGGRLVVTPT